MAASKRVNFIECPMILCDLDSAQRKWLAGLSAEDRRLFDGLDPWARVELLLPHRRVPKPGAKAKRVDSDRPPRR